MPEPEPTLMKLRMTSLLPAAPVAELEAHFGERFTALGELERLALATAAVDGVPDRPGVPLARPRIRRALALPGLASPRSAMQELAR